MPRMIAKPAARLGARMLLFLCLLLAGFAPGRTAAFTVTTTADSGPGSLRQAILDANAAPGLDIISFAIGAPGSQQTIQPLTVLPSVTGSVLLDGWSQGGADYHGPPLIVLNGDISGSYGLRITAGASIVRGLTVNGFTSGIILLTAGGNWIYGCFVGTDPAGQTAVPNTTGISVNSGAGNNIIGTDGDGLNDSAEANLISGNGDWGILVSQTGSDGNIIAGNKIGTNWAGTGAIPNGTNSSSRAGLYLGGTGNRVGTNGDGLSDLVEANLISGNHGLGLALNSQANPAAARNIIAGNFIGTDNSGLAVLPNSGGGIGSFVGPNFNITIQDNVIAGNLGSGIAVSGLNQGIISGNRIGVGEDGITPLGNGNVAVPGSSYGIFLSGSDNQIGGILPDEGNVIAHQTAGAAFRADGIALASSGQRNRIRGNAIYENKDLGIDLNDDNLANPNDAGDGDAGANGLQNYPVLSSAISYANGETVLMGTLDSQPAQTFTLDFYASLAADDSGFGEGEHYLGTAEVATDVAGSGAFDVTLPGVTLAAGQFVTAVATDAAGNSSEFSAVFGPVGGVQDVPISGLAAQALPPVYVDVPADLVATTATGSNVAFNWDFGDGFGANGSFVRHTFTAAGAYTATVTASNASGSVITSTLIAVLEPANINGAVWYDKDGDGFWGLGESAYLYPGGAVVTAALQGTSTTLSAVRDSQGNYQLLTPAPGLYLVEVARPLWYSTTPNPVAAAVGSDGGVTINFGMNIVPPAGKGRINGRAWIDANGNGRPDPNETPLANLAIVLRDGSGTIATSTTDASGWINLPVNTPGTYWLDVLAPPGHFPAQQTQQVTVTAAQVSQAHAPFLAGGTVSGQVSGPNGAGVAGATLMLLPDNLQATTDAGGGYSFTGLAEGLRTLRLTAPAGYLALDGQTERSLPVAFNSGAVENWALARLGQVTVQGSQISQGQALPVGEMFYELRQGDQSVQFAIADMSGQATFTGLAPGTYTVRPLPAAVLPGALVTPAERTVVVAQNSSINASFSFNLARSLSLYCRLPQAPPNGFACLFEVRNSNGSVIAKGALSPTDPATTLWNLNPATLEVRLIPDPAVAGQEAWPTFSQPVVLADNTHAHVHYPYNPTNPQTISGYAFWDRCSPIGIRANTGFCSESNVGSNNGLTVRLLDGAGAVISSTLTADRGGYSAGPVTIPSLENGYFAFPALPIGAYRVVVELPVGYGATTTTEYAVAVDGVVTQEPVYFGYQLNEQQSVYGRAFIDGNGNGSFDAADDALPGIPVELTTMAGNVLSSRSSSPDGSFTFYPVLSGERLVRISYNGASYTRVVSIPASGAVPAVLFALPPAGNQPRVLVFVDADRDGQADPDEQPLAGISVALLDHPCSQIGALLETAVTQSDGLAIFAPLSERLAAPVNGDSLCAAVTGGLPGNLLPAAAAGVNVSRSSGVVAALAVQPTSTVQVGFFWDSNGDGAMNGAEAGVGGGSVTLGGTLRPIPAGGPFSTTYLLLPGSYTLAATPPAGYQLAVNLPLTVVLNPNAAQTIWLPLRAAGSVSGQINGAPAALIAGQPVWLEAVNGGQSWPASANSLGQFSFANLPGGVYRLRLLTPPPGYAPVSEPLINLPVSGAHTENLALAPVGHVAGRLFIDLNGDGQRQANESGSNAFVVELVGLAGQLLQSVTPAPDGSFLLTGLNASTPYALQIAFPDNSWFTTASPGVFTLGAQTIDVALGVGYAFPGGAAQSGIVGEVVYMQAGLAIPVANARLEMQSGAGGPLGEVQTGSYGGFHFTTALSGGRARVVDVPGFADSGWVYWTISSKYCGNCVLLNGIYVEYRQIVLIPAATLALPGGSGAVVSWSVFRDDNGNGWRDAGEPGLPGAILGTGSPSNGSGHGELSLANGLHTLPISPPAGYLVSGPASRQLSVQGAAVTLPPIPLRPAGLTLISAFLDLNGNGQQELGEAGIGGVAVTLSGPGTANGLTAADGRLWFAGLPAGSYGVAVGGPAGFIAPPVASVVLSSGGVIAIPLNLTGLVSAVPYEEWDGDGRPAAGEIGFTWPYSLTLQAASATLQTVTQGGAGLFFNVVGGNYTLSGLDSAVGSLNLVVPPNGGAGAALPVVPPGVVRGTAWLDGNGDGLRQPQETPLAGVTLTLAGQTTLTDAAGRFSFGGVAPGIYNLAAALPAGLSWQPEPVVVAAGRGTAVPLAAQAGYALYLPIVVR